MLLIEMIEFCVTVLIFIGNVNDSTSTSDDSADTPQVGNNTAVPLKSPSGKVSHIQVMIPVNDTSSSDNTRLKVELPRCLCSLQSSSSESRYGLDPATLPSVVCCVHFLLVISVFCQKTHSLASCISSSSICTLTLSLKINNWYKMLQCRYGGGELPWKHRNAVKYHYYP